jgi:hypothetical protein
MGKRGPQRTPVIVRALAKIKKNPDNGCWMWTGSIVDGYGVVSRGGHQGKKIYVHQLMYQHFVGPIPEGLELDHLCRNRACCNPEHVEPVTRRENLVRGVGRIAKNVAATHCPQGHPYSPENTYVWRTKTGVGRACRICRIARAYAYKLKKKAASGRAISS